MKKLIDAKELAFKLAFNFQPDENEYVEGYNKALQDVMMLIAEMSTDEVPVKVEEATPVISQRERTRQLVSVLLPDTTSSENIERVVEYTMNGDIVSAVKLYKSITCKTLKDSKKAINYVQKEVGLITKQQYYQMWED